MKQKIVKQVNYWLGVTAIGLVLGLSLQFARAWTEPAVAPPGGNVGAPINTSGIPQIKEAGIALNNSGISPSGLIVNRNLIVTNGNVGIGTASPETEKLHVYDSAGSSGIFLGGNGTGGPHGIVFDDDTADAGVQLFWRTSPNQLIIEKSSAGTGTNGTDAFSYDRDTDYFYFAGNVGIGTTSPTQKLDVNGDIRIRGLAGCDTIDTDASGNFVCGTDDSGAGGGDGYLPDDPATSNVNMADHNIDNSGTITLGGGNTRYINGIAGLNSGGAPVRIGSGAFQLAKNGLSLAFKNNTGSTRMIIGNNGNVGIGTASPSTRLDVGGAIRTRPQSSATCNAGTIYYDSDDNHFYGCSGGSWVRLDGGGVVYQ